MKLRRVLIGLVAFLVMTALARRTGAVGGSPDAVEALDVLIRPNVTQETP